MRKVGKGVAKVWQKPQYRNGYNVCNARKGQNVRNTRLL